MDTIEQRCQQQRTIGWVGTDTVDPLGNKLVGVIGERRLTLMRRYLGERPGVPQMVAGLRLSRQGFGGPVSWTRGTSVSVLLVNQAGKNERVGIGVWRPGETEAQAHGRYEHPDGMFGRREDIVYVEIEGYPGSPTAADKIRVERWNEMGLGEEVLVVFDPTDLFEEIAWDIKRDPERSVQFWTEFCKAHELHYEHPDHRGRPGRCAPRPSTQAEDLAMLAYLAGLHEAGARTDQPRDQQAPQEGS